MNIVESNYTKFSQILCRTDGTEVKITSELFTDFNLRKSIFVYVHKRSSINREWTLCSDTPHTDHKKMSVSDYILNGRSEKMMTVTPAEILKNNQMLLNYNIS
jgi:hypothetical protein